MRELMEADAGIMPDWIKGIMRWRILSDTLEFRPHNTTLKDRVLAERLALELGIEIADYAAEMFAAQSEISIFSNAELLRMDGKKCEIEGMRILVSVLETTATQVVLDPRQSLMRTMESVAAKEDVAQVLLFVINILREEATLVEPNEFVRNVALNNFGVRAEGNSVVLPGIISRKRQIVPLISTFGLITCPNVGGLARKSWPTALRGDLSSVFRSENGPSIMQPGLRRTRCMRVACAANADEIDTRGFCKTGSDPC